MGLRLKAQLICLFLALSTVSFSVLTYFNLTLSAQDNLTRTELAARKLSEVVSRRVELCLRGDSGRKPDLQRLSGARGVALLEELQKIRELTVVDIFTLDRRRLLGSRLSATAFPEQEQAWQAVMTRSEPYVRVWAYSGEGDLHGQPLEQVGSLFHGRVQVEHYQAIFDDGGNRIGVLHMTIDVPRAPLRLNLVLLGNLWLGGIFLLSSLLAYYLWAEFAINRPLKGLMEAQQRLRELDPVRNDEVSLLSSNELVTISRSFNRLTLDLVKYQRELEEKTRRLEQANQSYRVLNEGLEVKVEDKTRDMKEFFSLITHDLRIPLAAVAGYAELLLKPRSGPLTDKQRKYTKSITVANSHALELVRNLLDAMRYEFGQPQIVEEDFDLSELAHEVVSHLAAQGPVETAVGLSISPTPCPVYADRTRIGRVLGNLLGNATRHACDVHLIVEAQPALEKVRVEVRDRGPGIPSEHLPLLFDKFKQFPSAEGPSSGLGLGLYIVRRILEDHQQLIEVESELGQGTAFHFYLPVGKLLPSDGLRDGDVA